jgi:hypothetical protein
MEKSDTTLPIFIVGERIRWNTYRFDGRLTYTDRHEGTIIKVYKNSLIIQTTEGLTCKVPKTLCFIPKN